MGILDRLRSEFSNRSAITKAAAEVGTAAAKLALDGWKKNAPTDVETAIGYSAYYHWKFNGEAYTGDTHHFAFPNESARLLALFVISQAQLSPALKESITRRHPGFDPAGELALASRKLSRTDPVWGECVTRSTILICRTLAYADSNTVEKPLDFMGEFDRPHYIQLGRTLGNRALGNEATNFLFGNP